MNERTPYDSPSIMINVTCIFLVVVMCSAHIYHIKLATYVGQSVVELTLGIGSTTRTTSRIRSEPARPSSLVWPIAEQYAA